MDLNKIKIAGTEYDGRVKLGERQREAVRVLSANGFSQREIGRMFGVSKSLVKCLVTGQKRYPQKKRDKEYWRIAKQRCREKKRKLIENGKLAQNNDRL